MKSRIGGYQQMHEKALVDDQTHPVASIQSVAINACGNGGQWERALALLDKVSNPLECWLLL